MLSSKETGVADVPKVVGTKADMDYPCKNVLDDKGGAIEVDHGTVNPGLTA